MRRYWTVRDMVLLDTILAAGFGLVGSDLSASAFGEATAYAMFGALGGWIVGDLMRLSSGSLTPRRPRQPRERRRQQQIQFRSPS
jgi:hypothetical protein